MMEILTTIALLCQIRGSNLDPTKIIAAQKQCQHAYVQCVDTNVPKDSDGNMDEEDQVQALWDCVKH